MARPSSRLIRIRDGPVLHEPEEIPESLRAAREALGLHHLSFEHSLQAGQLVSVLTSREAVQAEYEGRAHPVLPFYEGFWIGTQLKFRTANRETTFRSASLIILGGLATDELKTPHLRAEWEWPDDGARPQHAQPHWHVYRSTLDLIPRAASPDFGRFHLGMATRWHLNEDHSSAPTPESLRHWVRGCIIYTREQLAYLAAKAARNRV